MRKKKLSSVELFEQFYSDLYKQRWPSLKESLKKESHPISLSDKLVKPYYLDKASLIAANALPVEENDNVLDMCAAPGGKTLVLALKLKGTGTLVSNDRSSDRRARLHTVIEECLPKEYQTNIRITGHDSSTWGLYEQDMYDCVLLDAPCSSERHVIQDPKALDIWSPSRPKRLSILQYSMLNAAFTAVKVGGFILYSTCSICPMENQGVIAKLFKKHENQVEEIILDSNSEKLEYGQIILPDTEGENGPLYFCLLRRKS